MSVFRAADGALGPSGGAPKRGGAACERHPKGSVTERLSEERPFVALAPFLRADSRVVTLGVRPTLGDYTAEERRLLRQARRVLFPTMRFADVLEGGGCRCFPSAATYRYQRWRPLQWSLGAFLNLPMVRSRLCYGEKAKREIPRMFQPPFRVLGPRSGRDPVVLVDSWAAWEVVGWSERVRQGVEIRVPDRAGVPAYAFDRDALILASDAAFLEAVIDTTRELRPSILRDVGYLEMESALPDGRLVSAYADLRAIVAYLRTVPPKE